MSVPPEPDELEELEESLPGIDTCEFVKALLSADLTIQKALIASPGERIRIYHGDSEKPVYPLVRMTIMSEVNNTGNKSRVVCTPVLIRVEVIDDKPNVGRIKGLRQRIQKLLTNPATGNAGGSTIQGSEFERGLTPPNDTLNNVTYSRLGAEFRFFVHQKV